MVSPKILTSARISPWLALWLISDRRAVNDFAFSKVFIVRIGLCLNPNIPLGILCDPVSLGNVLIKQRHDLLGERQKALHGSLG